MRLVLKDADSGSRMGFAMPELRNCTSSLVSAAQVEMGEIPWRTKPITHLVSPLCSIRSGSLMAERAAVNRLEKVRILPGALKIPPAIFRTQ